MLLLFTVKNLLSTYLLILLFKKFQIVNNKEDELPRQ